MEDGSEELSREGGSNRLQDMSRNWNMILAVDTDSRLQSERSQMSFWTDTTVLVVSIFDRGNLAIWIWDIPYKVSCSS